MLAPGTELGRYQVSALLGVGGMGEVYRARDIRLDRDVAVKILPPQFASDPERIARFEREAKAIAERDSAIWTAAAHAAVSARKPPDPEPISDRSS